MGRLADSAARMAGLAVVDMAAALAEAMAVVGMAGTDKSEVRDQRNGVPKDEMTEPFQG
jgi:hypothetical protein